jgi:S1-C subfamily serine protease
VVTKKQQKQVVLKPHHRKPYRKRHLLSLTVSLLLIAGVAYQTGLLASRDAAEVPAPANTTQQKPALPVIRSSLGFSLLADRNLFAVSGVYTPNGGTSRAASPEQLAQNVALSRVTLKPLSGVVDSPDSASQLIIQMRTDVDPATPEQVRAGLFGPVSSSLGTTELIGGKADTLSGVPTYKSIYKFTPKFDGGPSYTTVWSGTAAGKVFGITLQGLASPDAMPQAYSVLLQSLQIAGTPEVKGVSTNILEPKAAADPSKLDPKYLADALSPAVVKIYHIVCGALVVNGQSLTTDSCTGFTGSGFIATSTGYIATNGHVVIYSAQEALVDILNSNPGAMVAFMRGLGLSGTQIQNISTEPAALASVISKIYDIPDDKLHFDNKKDFNLVALGDTAPSFAQLATSTDVSRYLKDTQDLKIAQVVATNYNPKDALTTIADPRSGFSSSDVALLKINARNAPTIAIDHQPVTQSQKLFLMGFPGDADNQLTDNRQLSVSITDGVVSSIRQAAGGKGKLYQSDADASHGNSGGPAVTEEGTVLGLLTYRASGDASGNAAKSYIRDINDFNDLAASQNVVLNSDSKTQQLWQEGLQLYAHNHYSAAFKNFEQVKALFPAQRLVDGYIDAAHTAVVQGKDVALVPAGWVIGGMVTAFTLAVISVYIIVRHNGRHKLWQVYQKDVAFAEHHAVSVH